MTNGPDDSRLRILAIQLNSIRENYAQKSFLGKLLHCINKEFVRNDTRGKIRFLKFLVREPFFRMGKWFGGRRKPAPDIALEAGIRVGAVLNGGMGDLAIYSALLDRFFRECGYPSIDVIVHPLRFEEAEFVFHDSPAMKRMLTYEQADTQPATTAYDIILKLGDFASCEFLREDRLRALSPELYERMNAARRIQHPYRSFIDVQPSLDGLFASVAARSGLRRLDVLGWLTNIPFTQDHQLHLSPKPEAYQHFIGDLGLAGKQYITVHNGWDNIAHRHAETVTKAWPEEHYVQFIERFKAKFPNIMVVQVGAKTSRPIPNVDRCLVNSTTLHEVAWILKHSLLHVDGDSGLVHLARSLHTKSIVLFGPTNHAFFHYAPNDRLSSDRCSDCWWSTPHWMRVCPRGLSEPECMHSIDPSEVLSLSQRHLTSLPAWELRAEDLHEQCSPAPTAWQGDYILDVLRSAEASGKKLRKVAILGEKGSVPAKLRAMGCGPTIFHLGGSEQGRHEPAPGGACGTEPVKLPPHRDFGSLYNIPAENEAYDAVVVPSLTPSLAFPYFAIKEFSRILKEDGVLVMTFDFSSEQPGASHAQGAGAADKFFEALAGLGAGSELPRQLVGGIVLCKSRTPDAASCRTPTERPELCSC